MSEFSATPYSIRESDRFLRYVEFELGDLTRWDEIEETLDLYIGRDPYAFEVVEGTEYRAVRLDLTPVLVVFFTIDEDERVVTFEAIERG